MAGWLMCTNLYNSFGTFLPVSTILLFSPDFRYAIDKSITNKNIKETLKFFFYKNIGAGEFLFSLQHLKYMNYVYKV